VLRAGAAPYPGRAAAPVSYDPWATHTEAPVATWSPLGGIGGAPLGASGPGGVDPWGGAGVFGAGPQAAAFGSFNAPGAARPNPQFDGAGWR